MSPFETEPGIRLFQMIRRPLLLLLILALIFTGKVNAQSQDPYVVLNTSKGTIVMRIYTGIAPRTANNFLDLVSRGFYNGLSFHRVENWVIQGGDPNGNGTGLFVDPETGQVRYLPLEASPYLHHNAPGVVAMAHSRSPNSGSCQFYITKKASPALDGSYSIFGGVVRGMDVVYNIQIGDRIVSAEIVNRSANRSGQPQGSASAPRQPPPTGESGF
jgi:peptidyl-prolyl cis-trans isomerase B (cyclophilin B)